MGRCGVGVDVDFNILTAFIRLGRAGPVRGRVPSIIIGIGRGALLIIILILKSKSTSKSTSN
jgi:hypothetical protein